MKKLFFLMLVLVAGNVFAEDNYAPVVTPDEHATMVGSSVSENAQAGQWQIVTPGHSLAAKSQVAMSDNSQAAQSQTTVSDNSQVTQSQATVSDNSQAAPTLPEGDGNAPIPEPVPGSASPSDQHQAVSAPSSVANQPAQSTAPQPASTSTAAQEQAAESRSQAVSTPAAAQAQTTEPGSQSTSTSATVQTQTTESQSESPTTVAEQPQSPEPVKPVKVDANTSLVQKSETDTNAAQHYDIQIAYPQIEGDALSTNAQQFNQTIKNMAEQEATQFKHYIITDSIHMNTLPEELRKNTLDMTYFVHVVKTGKQAIISVRLAIEGFQAGRAHPYHAYRVLNFDLTTGKELSLNDLFRSPRYLKVIGKYSEAQLSKKLTDKWMIAEGTKPLAKNFKNWNLEKDAILITFDEYQVAPYVDGAQEVEIPYGILKDAIAEKAPIYPCVRHLEVCSGN